MSQEPRKVKVTGGLCCSTAYSKRYGKMVRTTPVVVHGEDPREGELPPVEEFWYS